jgi:hypothetical protein
MRSFETAGSWVIRDSFTFSSGDRCSTIENDKLQPRFHRLSLIRIAGDAGIVCDLSVTIHSAYE